MDRLRRRTGGDAAAGPRAAWRGLVVAVAAALTLPPGTGACQEAGEGGEGPPGVASADTALARTGRELLPAVVSSSGLEAPRAVHLARRSPEELEAYLREEFRDQMPPEEAEGVAATYARLGLLPDTLDLMSFLRDLYLEQVVGYYDPEADTLFVMEGAPEGQLESVLVHEMVHALQDQRVNLDSLMEALEDRNDPAQALQAAVEGHATFVMTEWMVGSMTGRDVDLTEMSDLVERLPSLAAGGAESMPVLASAPRIIRETLTFPYVDGLRFVHRLWSGDRGRVAPLGRWLPASTEQVLHPEKLLEERDPPSLVELTSGAPEGWERVHADGLGELETRIFLTEHLGDGERARRAAAGWDGDVYALWRDAGGAEALAWVSVWDAAAEADSFAAAARDAFRARYGDAADRDVLVERAAVEGRPGVRVLDLPTGVPPEPFRAAAAARVPGEGGGP